MLRTVTAFLTCAFAVSALAGGSNPPAAGARQFEGNVRTTVSLTGADGQAHAPLADRGQKATVLVFLMHDCPVTNASAPELARLANDFAPRGVEFFRIYIAESAAEIETHGKEYGLKFAALLDPKLELAHLVGATRAPEAAVLSPQGALLYRGRIDNRAVKPGVTRPDASRRDLRIALEAVLAGHKPEPRFTTSIGCYLPAK